MTVVVPTGKAALLEKLLEKVTAYRHPKPSDLKKVADAVEPEVVKSDFEGKPKSSAEFDRANKN